MASARSKTLTDKEIKAKIKALEQSEQKECVFNVGGVAGLAVRWRGANSIQWLLRVQTKSLRIKKTASFASMSLREAREWAAFILANNGKTQKEIEAEQTEAKTVAELWPDFLTAFFASDGWTYSEKARHNKEAFGRRHIFPYIGGLRPDEIDYPHVIAALNGAISADNRKKRLVIIRQFLNWCKPQGLRTKPLPTDLSELKSSLVVLEKKANHQPVVSWQEVPRFVCALMSGKNSRSIGALALLFKILTIARNAPIRLATWAEFDETLTLWTVPRQHMKEKKEKGKSIRTERTDPHLVPLSNQAQAILLLLKELKSTTGLVFGSGFGANFGRPISDRTLKAYIERVSDREERAGRVSFRDTNELDDDGRPRVAVPHGFRSDFESWALEHGFPERIINMCQDHLDKTDNYNRAYRRDTQLPARRELLQAWADYCLSQCPADWCKW